MDWIKGKPTEAGLYWVAMYVGQGEFDSVLILVFHSYTEEQMNSSEYPKPNHPPSGYSGDAFAALIEYEKSHPKDLFYYNVFNGSQSKALLSLAWIEYHQLLVYPELPTEL